MRQCLRFISTDHGLIIFFLIIVKYVKIGEMVGQDMSNIFLKNLLCCNMLLTVLAITSTRFMFVCIYKSIPSMDDDFFANLLYRSINLISLLLVSIRVKSPGKYPLNYVRLISSPSYIIR